jgi:hypothetical protein
MSFQRYRKRGLQFVVYGNTGAGGPQPFYLTAAVSPEDEDVAGYRVIFQRRLHFCGETIEAVAHVGDAATG